VTAACESGGSACSVNSCFPDTFSLALALALALALSRALSCVYVCHQQQSRVLSLDELMLQEEMEAQRRRAEMEMRRQELGPMMAKGPAGAWSEAQVSPPFLPHDYSCSPRPAMEIKKSRVTYVSDPDSVFDECFLRVDMPRLLSLSPSVSPSPSFPPSPPPSRPLSRVR
jgi:hypothetical protein